MRSLGELIDEVKFRTNKANSTRFSDESLIRFFDAAQREVQRTIFNSYPQDPIVSKVFSIPVVQGQRTYTMPTDMLTPVSVFSVVPFRVNGQRGEPLSRLSQVEASHEYGYLLQGGNIEINPASIIGGFVNGTLCITYANLLPRLTDVSDVSELPTICEEYLLRYVERSIHKTDGSDELVVSSSFTQDEKQEIRELFANSSRDVKYVVTTNGDYINY